MLGFSWLPKGNALHEEADWVRHTHPGSTLAGTGVTCHHNTQTSSCIGTDFAPESLTPSPQQEHRGHVCIITLHTSSIRHSALGLAGGREILSLCINDCKTMKQCSGKQVWCESPKDSNYPSCGPRNNGKRGLNSAPGITGGTEVLWGCPPGSQVLQLTRMKRDPDHFIE